MIPVFQQYDASNMPLVLSDNVKIVLRYLRENEFPVRIHVTTLKKVVTYESDHVVWLTSTTDGLMAYRLRGGPHLDADSVRLHTYHFPPANSRGPWATERFSKTVRAGMTIPWLHSASASH